KVDLLPVSRSTFLHNDDILTENLIRLPVTSILRFKSVSKHWRSLLTHTHFTRRYDNNNFLKSPGLFARNAIYVPFNIENRNQTVPHFNGLNFCYEPYGIITVQSCNGLLLCCTHPQRDRSHRKYYVFNPTTKQFATIPSVTGGQRVRRTIGFMGPAFPQTNSVCYKLVCVRYLKRKADLFQIQVYSSETRKWKICIESFSAREPVFDQGVYWNGAVYWAPFCGHYFCFKVDDEQLQTLPLPDGLAPLKVSAMYFGESRGHLHLILNVGREENSFNVYEMLRDHSGWFVKYRVELDELRAAFPEIVGQYSYYEFKVVDVVRGEAEEDTFMVLNTEEKIIRFNFRDKSFKQIFTLPSKFDESYRYKPFYEDFSCFHRYTETLTSL
ncbi:F-box protein At5g07610-like, partial [Bidens hawaiensis]|uniref:F-box protein At5g07610-like n=1 Tax=Bidens hawaiensis TaxID=980011 RepID=UPI00404A67E2